MKYTLNLVLTLTLFCSAAIAGDLGNGGYQGCTINCPPPPCGEYCDGSTTGQNNINDSGSIEANVIWAVVRQYLGLAG